MATLELKGIRKTYPGATAETIRGVDLAVADGEFIVILGPSGCGKSTLLRIVAGLETPSAGELLIGGTSAIRQEPKDRNLAMVFQNYALYPHMTVRANLSYALKLRRLPKAEIDRRVGLAAGILGLDGLLERKPRQLSGGQRQRVAMGRAIVREPAAFLFDEPLSNLDAKLRVQMRAEIKSLQQRLGVTSLYVTHDQVEAMTLAHRIVVMNGGVVEQVATPLELYNRPASVFVAGFTGSPPMNLLPAVSERDGGLARLADGQALALDAGRLADGPLTVGLRPETVSVRAVGQGPVGRELAGGELAGGELAAEVVMVEALGADTMLHLRCGDVLLAARQPAASLYAAGERLALSWPPDALHLFDGRDGQRLN